MNIQEITLQDALYEQTLPLRTEVISIPFGFPPPTKENESPDSRMFVAIDNEQVIGFAMITPSKDRIRARQVSVIPERQRQGIGKQLMAKAEAVAKSMGYPALDLFAHTDSHPFYLKLGYVKDGEWQTHDNGLKTIFMYKTL